MKFKVFLVFAFVVILLKVKAQPTCSADFNWGNGYYYNLKVGEQIIFHQVEVELLKVDNHYNLIRVGADTLWMKVARHTLPEETGGIRLFVADNRTVKALSSDSGTHGLLKGDALLCLSDSHLPLLDPHQFVFPVSFNNGFTWSAEEDSHPFSFYKTNDLLKSYISYPGLGIDMHEARGRQMHWMVAVEESRVVWVNEKVDFAGGNQSCVLLKSAAHSDIYYVYNYLFTNNVAVKAGQKLLKGEALATAWGNDLWGHVLFAVIRSNTEPSFQQVSHNIINGFPQLLGLYNQRGNYMVRNFSRGKIIFGGPRSRRGNVLNNLEFEPFTGKGWITGKWNPAGKVECISKDNEGNIRIKKVLFEGTLAESRNPLDYFDYQVSVLNGAYRIRAKVGDVALPSWQQLEFEGVNAGTKTLKAGEFSWTGERIVRVKDGTLTIRIFVDAANEKIAGLSELVFQAVH